MTAPEDVFAGPAIEMSARKASDAAQFGFSASSYEPRAAPAGPVRHAAGYAPFVGYMLAHEVDPRALALALSGSALELLRFLRTHASALAADPELLHAAGIFLGNSIVSMRADAAWRSMSPGPDEVGAGRRSFLPSMILERLTLPLANPGAANAEAASDATIGADAETGMPTVGWAPLAALQARPASLAADEAELETHLRGIDDMLKLWVAEADDDALPPPPLPTPRPPASGTPRYERPPLPSTVFLDEAGEPINYGNRWGMDRPPENSYSVELHPERFAGLHIVAHALIEYLQWVYDVEVVHEQAPDAAAPLLRPHGGVRELVRVQPRDPQAAPLRFAFTDYPGVIVEAGVLHGFAYPMCGCEACDERVDYTATEMENLVRAVTNGGYAEHYPVGRRRDLFYGLVAHDDAGALASSGSGGGAPGGLSAAQLAHGEAVLAALPHGWQPWPLRG